MKNKISEENIVKAICLGNEAILFPEYVIHVRCK